MYYKINNEYYLDKNDIGKLVTVKRNSNYSFLTSNHENCVILSLSYSNSDRIRPKSMKLLDQSGKIIKIYFARSNKIEIKFL